MRKHLQRRHKLKDDRDWNGKSLQGRIKSKISNTQQKVNQHRKEIKGQKVETLTNILTEVHVLKQVRKVREGTWEDKCQYCRLIRGTQAKLDSEHEARCREDRNGVETTILKGNGKTGLGPYSQMEYRRAPPPTRRRSRFFYSLKP